MFKTISNTKRKQWLYGVIVLLWMALIFYFSAQNGSESSDLSDGVLKWLGSLLHIDLFQVPFISFLQTLIRKGAHASVYFVLAIWLYLCFYHSNHRKQAIFIALIGSFGYACSDEVHQLFIPGRAGMFQDVLIDTLGASIAMFLFPYIHKHYCIRRHLMEEHS